MMNGRHYIWLLVLLALPLFTQGVFDHPLWLNDEGHVAEIGREMYLSGDVVVPRLAGEPFLEKPPLYFMVMSVSYHLFGITPGAARLPSAVFGFLAVLIVYAIAAAQGRRRQGMLAAFLLATTMKMFHFSHWCVVDSAVCFFTAMAFFAFLRAYQATRFKLGWYVVCYAACALAFMSKGLIAPVMVGVAVLALLIWDKNWRELPRMGLWAGGLTVALIVSPWLAALWIRGGPELFRNFFIDNNLGRFCLTISERYPEHARGFFYYFYNFPGSFMPWTPLFFPAVVWAFRQARADVTPARPFYRFLLAGFFLNLVVFSFSATKRGVYILPLYPLVTLFIGGWLDELLAGRTPVKAEKVFLWLQAILLAVAPFIILVGLWLFAPTVSRVVLIIFVGIAAGIILLTWWAQRSQRWRTVVISLAVQTVFSYVLIIWLVFPVANPYKHYTPYFEQLAADLQPDDYIATYKGIHEANLGQACITLNRLIPAIKDPKQLLALLKQQTRRVFILVEEWRYAKIEPLLPDHVTVFYSPITVNPVSHSTNAILRCLTNVSGDRRPSHFQIMEKSAVPFSKIWNIDDNSDVIHP